MFKVGDKVRLRLQDSGLDLRCSPPLEMNQNYTIEWVGDHEAANGTQAFYTGVRLVGIKRLVEAPLYEGRFELVASASTLEDTRAYLMAVTQ